MRTRTAVFLLTLVLLVGIYCRHSFSLDPITVQSRFKEKLRTKSSHWQEPEWTLCNVKDGLYRVEAIYQDEQSSYDCFLFKDISGPIEIQINRPGKVPALLLWVKCDGEQARFTIMSKGAIKDDEEEELLKAFAVDVVSAFRSSYTFA